MYYLATDLLVKNLAKSKEIKEGRFGIKGLKESESKKLSRLCNATSIKEIEDISVEDILSLIEKDELFAEAMASPDDFTRGRVIDRVRSAPREKTRRVIF